MLERYAIALCLMGLEQSEGFLNHAQVRLAPLRQWQDQWQWQWQWQWHDQGQPLEPADFMAPDGDADFEIKEADVDATRLSRNEWHSNDEPLERAAR